MDPERPSRPPRKVKYAPRATTRRKSAKTENDEGQFKNGPIILPLTKRRPSDSVFLDDANELSNDATNEEYNLAKELKVDSAEPKMFFLQLPPLPFEQSVSRKGKEKIDEPTASDGSPKGGVQDLPAGHMGKLLMYESGAVKLKLGENLFDVSQGSNCAFRQDVVAINTAEKHCCAVGEIVGRAVVTPDIDSIDLNQ